MSSKKKIVVGMSGGVDSSVVAAVLKEQGHEVIGIFMKNWEELDENGQCSATKDYEDVVRVCEQLDIPYYNLEFVKEYRENVFAHFLDEYKKGRTPNPDILCNREIKFKVFFEQAMKLGADFLATGHYCRKDENNQLLKGVDQNKDQSYFLHAIKKDVLKKVLFPIGDIEKSKVREIADKYNLATKSKKDSTGICFIGERNFKNFLSEYIDQTKGEFRHLDESFVAHHSGTPFYTLGQRKGLGLGGAGKPWFVVAKNTEENIVYVERGDDHPALYRDFLYVDELSLIDDEVSLEENKAYTCKIRYRQKDQACEIKKEGERIKVLFKSPQRAATLGQSVVFYSGDICHGGGVICELGPSYFDQGRDLPK